MAARDDTRRGVLTRDPSVMRQNIEQFYHAWEAAPSNKKTDLLLRGPTLAWAESLLLTGAAALDPGLKQYIQRSLASGAVQSAAGRALAETEELTKESRTYWAVIAMVAFSAMALLPPLVRDVLERTSATTPVAAISKPAAGENSVPNLKLPIDEAKEVKVANASASADRTAVSSDSRVGELAGNQPGMTLNWSQRSASVPQAAPVTQASLEAPLPPRTKRSKSELEITTEQMQHLSQMHDKALHLGEPAVAAQIALEAFHLQKSKPGLEKASELERAAMTMVYRSFGTRTSLLAAGDTVARDGKPTFCKAADRAQMLLADGRLVVLDVRSRRNLGALAPEPDFGRQAAVDHSCSKAAFVTEDHIVRLAAMLETKPFVRLFGHDADISSTEFSADGHKAITASFDATARIWDARSGRTIATLRGHEDRVLGAKLSPDARIAVTWSDDRSIRVWDASTGRQLSKLDGHSSPVTGATFTPDSARVITMALDGLVRIWSASTGKLDTRLEPRAGGVTSVEFSRDGQRIATIEHEGTIGIWNAASLTRIAELKVAESEFRQVAFSQDAQMLATITWSGRIAIWHTESGRRLAELSKPSDGTTDIRFSGDGMRIEAVTETGAILSWAAFSSAQRAVEHLIANAGPCLTGEQQVAFQLSEGPAPWCRTAEGHRDTPEPTADPGQDP